jgi:hypothetical protein
MRLTFILLLFPLLLSAQVQRVAPFYMGAAAPPAGGGDSVKYEADAGVTIEYGATTSVNLTVGSQSNRAVIVFTYTDTDSGTTITVGGNAATKFGVFTDLSGTGRYSVWYRLNPSSGTNAVAFSGTNNDAGRMTAYSLYNVNQTTPIRLRVTNSSAGAATLSASLTSCTVRELLLCLMDVSGGTTGITSTDDSGQTRQDSGTYFSVFSSTKAVATAGTNTIGYNTISNTGVPSGIIAVAVQPPSP